MKKMRALLVGCGLVARVKYLPALKKMCAQLEAEGVCDREESQARAMALSLGTSAVHTDFTEALEKIQPEVVILCTPPQTHRALGIQSLQAGAHVFMEKPMALNSADCRALIDAAKQADRRLCVCFSQSFTPVVLQAQRLIARGVMGKLRAMQIFLSTPTSYMTSQPDHWVHRLPGGVLSETGPHVIHLARRFLGPIQKAQLVARKQHSFPWSAADDLRLNLSCVQGNCSIVLLYLAEQWAARVDLIGDTGRLFLDLEAGVGVLHRRGRLSPLDVFKSSVSDAAQIFGQSLMRGLTHLTGNQMSGQEILLRQFIQSIRQGLSSPVDPSEGLEVTRVLETITAPSRGSSL